MTPILPLFNCVAKYNWKNKEIHLEKGKCENNGKSFHKLHYLNLCLCKQLFLAVTPWNSSASDTYFLLQCHRFVR